MNELNHYLLIIAILAASFAVVLLLAIFMEWIEKKVSNRKSIKTLLTVGLLLLAVLFTTHLTGCGTTPERASLTAAGVQVLTVDAAMKAFHDQAVAGKVTQAQLDAVNKWYPVYYNAGLIQKQAFKAYVASKSPDTKQALDAAVASFLSAESNIVDILTQTLGNVRIVKKAGNK